MKIKTLFLFVIFTSGIGFSQTSSSLKAEIQKLYTSFDDIDLEAVSNKLCSEQSAADVYKILDSYFLNDDNKFRFVFTNTKFNYSDYKSIEGKIYCKINFRNVIRISYFHKLGSGEVSALQKSFKEKFNAESVMYQSGRNAFLIVYNAKMTAFSESNNDHWKFIFNDNTLPLSISENCLSDPAIKKL